MRKTVLIAAIIGCAALIGGVYAITNSRFDYKLSKIMQQQRADHMAEAMEDIGADLTNVTISIRNHGDTVTLNGTVPDQGDLDRINLVVEKFGPFKNLRNYVKVKPITAKDGIVVELDEFKHIDDPAEAAESGDTNDCPAGVANGSCEKLYAEREELLKQLRPLVIRKISERYVVFDDRAAAPLKRFREVSELLDSSMCYKPGAAPSTNTPPAAAGKVTNQ